MVGFFNTNLWGRKMRMIRNRLALIVAVGILAIGSAFAEDQKNRLPEKQKSFLELTTSAIEASDGAKNDMQRGGIKTKRDDGICKKLKSRKVEGWQGKVTKVDSNSDGKGVLSIELAPNVSVKTWNNALSDISYDTLIDPRSSLFEKASQLSEGDQVKFSGSFFRGDGSCIKESSMSLRGGLEEPEFIFKFTDVEKI